MSEKRATILLVEDDAPQRMTLAGFLRKRGYEVLEAQDAASAQALGETKQLDILVTDLRLGGPDGVSVLKAIRSRQPDVEAVVVTGYGTVEDAVRAMHAGAYDVLSKPLDLDRLEAVLEKVVERVNLARENRALRQTLTSLPPFASIVGDSEPMRRAKELAAKVAPSRASVLLLGESGTGKEVFARAIHLASPRRDRAFVAVNCAALPETLVEAELFGHERGAFTGASIARPGRFEMADGGTLFLDEIGDIPLSVQVKLLRVLQEGTIERIGSTTSRTVDVRVIAATHRDLPALIREGRFREDLYYRLNVVAISLPPLRERPSDIPALVDHFLRKHSALAGRPVMGIEPDALEALRRWRFPGNVRELENLIERAIVLADGVALSRMDFPEHIFEPEPVVSSERTEALVKGADPGMQGSLEEQVARLETTLIQAALKKTGGNKSAAARELGLTERAIRYKIRKYGLE